MTYRKSCILFAGVAAMALAAPSAGAETLRWARSGDSLTLDPHAQNEGPTHTMSHQIYEPLLHRDMSGEIVPALATDWAPTDDPEVWRFNLREGVSFHNGNAFDSADVVFSLNRAMQPTSDMKELLGSVSEVRADGPHAVEIVTDGPNPLLPNNLTNLFIMDEEWARANDTSTVQDFAGGGENYATRHANGTGAFELVSREPDNLTVLERNEDYWGADKFPMEISRIEMTPIQSASTRVAALLSGEVDFMQDVPVQDLERLSNANGVRVNTAPQNRTIFLGLNVGADDLRFDDVEGENPFADVRVRRAMNMAINRDAIQQVVMRGQSVPTGVIMPPFVNGWTEALDQPPEHDVEQARSLLAEAGYEDGFSVTLHCPNDRYINDEAICQAVTGMFGQIGIDVTLEARPKSIHFPALQNREIDFYMLGWSVPTFDSEYIFDFLVHTMTERQGTWNATRYSNPELDEKIEQLSSMTDLDARDELIGEIWQEVQSATIYLPIHHQVLNWAMTDDIDFPVQSEDQPHFKYLAFDG